MTTTIAPNLARPTDLVNPHSDTMKPVTTENQGWLLISTECFASMNAARPQEHLINTHYWSKTAMSLSALW